MTGMSWPPPAGDHLDMDESFDFDEPPAEEAGPPHGEGFGTGFTGQNTQISLIAGPAVEQRARDPCPPKIRHQLPNSTNHPLSSRRASNHRLSNQDSHDADALPLRTACSAGSRWA